MPIQTPDNTVVGRVVVSLLGNGDINVSGNLVNRAQTLELLQQGLDYMRAYWGNLEGGTIVTISKKDTDMPQPKHYSFNAETAKFSVDGSDTK